MYTSKTYTRCIALKLFVNLFQDPLLADKNPAQIMRLEMQRFHLENKPCMLKITTSVIIIFSSFKLTSLSKLLSKTKTVRFNEIF